MLSENPPEPAQTEIEPIPPEEAEAILQEVLAPYLAEDWHVLHHDAYSARITQGARNLDIRVDLLGQITTQESDLTPLQDSGRLMAWVMLWTMLLVALAIASALGLL